MMNVVFAGSFAAQLAEPVRRHLPVSCQVTVQDELDDASALADADVLVSMALTARMAERAPRLRLVQVPGAGLDRIDLAALRPDTHLANVYGHEVGIAEYVIGAMIALTRSLDRLDGLLRQGTWESQWTQGTPPPLWPELAGQTLGILGYGHIGRAIARRAHAFDMHVHAVRRRAAADGADPFATVSGPERLDDVIARADHLVVTLPLDDTTRHLIDARRLRSMKSSAVLINVARGEIVEEAALYRALSTGAIAGAVIDVWYRYPYSTDPTLPSSQPFHELANVIMTPHVSGWTAGMLAARARLIADNVARVSRGELPRNLIERG